MEITQEPKEKNSGSAETFIWNGFLEHTQSNKEEEKGQEKNPSRTKPVAELQGSYWRKQHARIQW